MTFSTFEEWQNGDIAQATLRAVYEAMKLSSSHHDTEGESWRRKPWRHHMQKGWFHLLSQFEAEKHIAYDTKIKPDSAPPTMLPHLVLALTRLAFAVTLWRKEGVLPVTSVGPLVDSTMED